MKHNLILLLVLLGVPLTAACAADAPSAPSPLEICGPEPEPTATSRERATLWTANCLITVIRAKDRRALGALYPRDKHAMEICPNGKFCFETFEDVLFGEPGGPEEPTTVHDLFTRHQKIEIVKDPQSGDILFVANMKRWRNGTAKERLDFFRCDFEYDVESGRMRISNLFSIEGDAWLLYWDDGKDYGPQP